MSRNRPDPMPTEPRTTARSTVGGSARPLAAGTPITPGSGSAATGTTNPAPTAAPTAIDGELGPRLTPSVPPAATEPDLLTDLPEDRYFNRELSWLDFNTRVL
ncbi:MAG: RNA degradosome polyphosphate kinase, partial [Sciscionella sp.]